jgi:hypothetical protein
MRTRILIIALLSFLAFNAFAQNTIFEKINNKTWFEEIGFAGTTIVFYETSNGLLKAIRQNNGSGVPVISSGIYDVEIVNDTIFLLNGLNLKTSEKLRNYTYTFDNVTEQIIQLERMSDFPVLFTWTDKRKDLKTQIDVRLLSEILIEKNEIYKERDLIKTLIDN